MRQDGDLDNKETIRMVGDRHNGTVVKAMFARLGGVLTFRDARVCEILV